MDYKVRTYEDDILIVKAFRDQILADPFRPTLVGPPDDTGLEPMFKRNNGRIYVCDPDLPYFNYDEGMILTPVVLAYDGKDDTEVSTEFIRKYVRSSEYKFIFHNMLRVTKADYSWVVINAGLGSASLCLIPPTPDPLEDNRPFLHHLYNYNLLDVSVCTSDDPNLKLSVDLRPLLVDLNEQLRQKIYPTPTFQTVFFRRD